MSQAWFSVLSYYDPYLIHLTTRLWTCIRYNFLNCLENCRILVIVDTQHIVRILFYNILDFNFNVIYI